MNWFKKPSNILFVCLLGFAFVFTLVASIQNTPTQIPADGIGIGISIINTTATLMGVVIGLIAIVIGIVGTFGFLEIREWRRIRGDIEKKSRETEKVLNRAKKDAEIIEGIRDNTDREASTLRKEVELIGEIMLLEELTEENKVKLDELSRRLELIKLFGGQLSPIDYLNIGNNYFYKAIWRFAFNAYENAIELKHEYAEAWNNKGLVYDKLELYEDAQAAYDKAIEIRPNYADAWNNKGVSLSKRGHWVDEIKSYDEAIKFGAVLDNICYFRIARCERAD